MKQSLPKYALDRPVTVTMLVLAVLALGVVAWPRIPREFMLDIDYPVLRCLIPYPGATPSQVEREVAIPAEGQFRTVPGLAHIQSQSTSNGCWVEMLFNWGTDMSLTLGTVRDRIERLKQDIPQEIDRIILTKSGSDTQPMLSFTIFSDEDDRELAHWIRTQLEPRLTRIEGVAEVDTWGADAGSVYVDFDQDALRAANLSLYDVVMRLRDSNVDLAVGRLSDGILNRPIRVVSNVTRPGDLGDTIIGPRGLRLKNVATISQPGPGADFRNTIDGRKGVFVRILKSSGANTIDTCRAVKAELARLKADPVLRGLEVFTFEDQSRDMLAALDMLTYAGGRGSLLALAILYAFMRRVRPTLIVAASVPISTVVGFVAIYFTGMTLNAVTLASMVICLGMLVDNSIVVMENILRYREMGFSARESAHRGAGEVSLAITMATLTTVVVFFPVFYIDTGELSIYMREFAVPVTVALVASLVVSLTVIPLAASRLTRVTGLKGLTTGARSPAPARATWPRSARLPIRAASIRQMLSGVRPIQRASAAYCAVLGTTLRWRLASLLMLGALLGITYAVPGQRVGAQTLPRADMRRVEVRVQFDQSYDWSMASPVFDAIEDIINEHRDQLGIENVFVSGGAGGGELRAYLIPLASLANAGPQYSTEEVRMILKALLPRLIPGGEVRVNVVEGDAGGGSTIALRMRGEDVEILKRFARRFALLLESVPNVTDALVSTENETEEIQLVVNEVMAAQTGITPYMIAQTVDFALRGTRVFYLKQGGKEVPVIAGFGAQNKKTMGDLENVAVLSQSGQLVPLADLVTRHIADAPRSIQRVDGKSVVNVLAHVTTSDLSHVKQDIDRMTADFHLPPGYEIDQGERLADLDINAANYGTALVLAIILIYVVMGALFESYLLPLSVLTAVPLAFIGIYWAMYVTGTPMDVISMIGAILMCGVVVNNGIVLVDHINRLRTEQGHEDSVIVRACRDRFRPVMMTSLTTVLGCIPLAVGSQVADMGFSSVGWTLVGGLSAGTLLTLFVVPLFYAIMEDLRIWTTRYFASVAALFHRAPA